MKEKKLFIVNLAIIMFSLLCFIFLFSYGKAHRKYLNTPVVRTVGQPKDSLNVWKESGIYGRILFCFDKQASDDSRTDTEIKRHYIYKAIEYNLIRRVYHVIPDADWAEAEKTLKNFNAVPRGDSFRFTIEGTPVVVMRLKNIHRIEEKVVVDINASSWDEQSLLRIAEILKDGILKSDLITVSGNIPEEVLMAIRNN